MTGMTMTGMTMTGTSKTGTHVHDPPHDHPHREK
ncbi:hypothetical protein RKD29_000985 [Streptomyces tendae]